MRILVTGAAGFIGSNLVDRLLARGDDVIGLDNFDPFYSPAEKRTNLEAALTNPRFELVEGDITDGASLERAMRAVPDTVAHLAARAGVRPSILDPLGYHAVNVDGTQAVLDAAAEHGVAGLVFASSSSVYGNSPNVPFREDDPTARPISPYGSTKWMAEANCRTHQARHGGSVVCLRFFTAYGPRQRPDLAIRKFITLMSQGRPIPLFGDGTSERDYTWIDDILDGVVAAIDRVAHRKPEFEVINLGGNRPASLQHLVDLLADAMGLTPEVERLPDQPGDVRRTWADLTKAHQLLGYTPHTTLEDGIPKFVHWFKNSTPKA